MVFSHQFPDLANRQRYTNLPLPQAGSVEPPGDMAIGTYEILVAAPCESVTLLHVGVSSRLSPRLLDQGGVIFLVGGFCMLLWTTPAWVKSSTPRTTFGAVEVDVSESPGRDTGEPRWFGDLPQPFRSAWPCCVHW